MDANDNRPASELSSRERLGELFQKLENIESMLAEEDWDNSPVELLESVLEEINIAGKQILRITRDLYYSGEDFERCQRFATTLFDASPMALCVIGRDAEIVEINTRAARQLGLRHQRWRGLQLSELFADRQVEHLQRLLDRCWHTDSSISFQARLADGADPESDRVQVTILPLPDSPVSDGAFLSMIRIGQTTEVPGDDRIQQLQRNATLGKMATGLTHEFKNLLGVITTWSELGLRHDDCPAPVREALDKISHAAERGADLTDSILDYGRGQKLDAGVLEVNSVLEQNARLFEPLLPAEIELELDLQEEPAVIWFDETQFEQIVLNLVLNARDAIEHDGHIRICAERIEIQDGESISVHGRDLEAGTYVGICVADTGCGMDAATLEEACEPFYTTKENEGGTGLGLPTVREIVEKADGRLLIDSEPMRGTEVRVLFPHLERRRASAEP